MTSRKRQVLGAKLSLHNAFTYTTEKRFYWHWNFSKTTIPVDIRFCRSIHELHRTIKNDEIPI